MVLVFRIIETRSALASATQSKKHAARVFMTNRQMELYGAPLEHSGIAHRNAHT